MKDHLIRLRRINSNVRHLINDLTKTEHFSLMHGENKTVESGHITDALVHYKQAKSVSLNIDQDLEKQISHNDILDMNEKSGQIGFIPAYQVYEMLTEESCLTSRQDWCNTLHHIGFFEEDVVKAMRNSGVFAIYTIENKKGQ